MTDNPVYIPADAARPHGTVFSTGGFHNSRAPAGIDGVAFAWADLCQLAQRHVDKLFQHPSTAALLADEFTYKPLHMVANGWAEEARALAQPTLISLGAFGQNDVPSQALPAWRKATAIGQCLDSSLAVLAVLASLAMTAGRHPVPPALAGLVAQVDDCVPTSGEVRRLGLELETLAMRFSPYGSGR